MYMTIRLADSHLSSEGRSKACTRGGVEDLLLLLVEFCGHVASAYYSTIADLPCYVGSRATADRSLQQGQPVNKPPSFCSCCAGVIRLSYEFMMARSRHALIRPMLCVLPVFVYTRICCAGTDAYQSMGPSQQTQVRTTRFSKLPELSGLEVIQGNIPEPQHGEVLCRIYLRPVNPTDVHQVQVRIVRCIPMPRHVRMAIKFAPSSAL